MFVDKEDADLERIFICSDNHELQEVKTKIGFSWEHKYIGRKIIPEKYEKLFNHNGHYPEDDYYDMAGFSINLKPMLDEYGTIVSIDYYKMKDLYCGHGRPASEDYALSRRDVALFCKILDGVTEDYIETEYLNLCNSCLPDCILPGGYRFKKHLKAGISFLAPDGSSASIGKEKLIRALYVSHFYVDVLNCEETLKESSVLFAEKDIPLYLAALSMVDYRGYAGIEQLLTEAKNREIGRSAKEGYAGLIHAVRNNDFEAATEYVDYAKIVMDDDDCESPLLIAVRNNNLNMVSLLLEHGALSIQSYIGDGGVSISPLLEAVKNKNFDIIRLLCEHRGSEGRVYRWSLRNPADKFNIEDVFDEIKMPEDIEMLEIILPYAAMAESVIPYSLTGCEYLSVEMIERLSRIEGARISWPLSYVETVYRESKDLCKGLFAAIMRQGSANEVLDYLIEKNEFDLFALCINAYSRVDLRDSFWQTYDRDIEWYRLIESKTDPSFNYMSMHQHRDRYLGQLIKRGEYDRYISVVENLGCGPTLHSLSNGFVGYADSPNPPSGLNEFFEYVLENIDYVQKYDPRSSSQYDSGFSFFSKALYTSGAEKLCGECLKRYPLKFVHDEKYFLEICGLIILNRIDSFLEYALRLKCALVGNGDAPKVMLRLLEDIISQFKRANDKRMRFNSNESSVGEMNAERWTAAAKTVVSLISLEDMQSVMNSKKYKLHPSANTLYDYAKAEGVKDEAFLVNLEF